MSDMSDMSDIIGKDITIVKDITITPVKRARCYHCNKKLKMIQFTCKCSHQFCINHLNPHNHNCQYDYKTEKEKKIIENNPLIHNKMTKI